MIADSTYDARELIGRPGAGAVTGAVAATLMLALIAGLDSPDSARVWLGDVARVMLPASLRTPASLAVVGLFVHLTVGSLCGALYAACQQRTSTGGLFVVGAFYGFMIWLVGDLILVRLFGVGPQLLQTWSGLLVTVAYGLILATWAARSQKASGRLGPATRPVD
jgi:ABC-type Fe3+/spermidine/putrescine transport system ATPase subunit